MKLTLLGTGTPLPDVERRGNSQVVEIGDDLTLIDAGAGTLYRLVEAGYMSGNFGVQGAPKLKRILFTHLYHPDHCTGLADVLWACWIQRIWDGQIVISGPPGTARFVERLIDAYSYDVQVRTGGREGLTRDGLVPLVEEIEEGWSAETNDMRISAFRVEHQPVDQAFGFRLDSANGSMVFSGDTTMSENLIKHSQDTDLLVHEVFGSSAFGRMLSDPNILPARKARMEFVQSYHTPSDQLGKIATLSNARQLVMSHLILGGGTPADLISDVAPSYHGKTTVGDDLMTFELTK